MPGKSDQRVPGSERRSAERLIDEIVEQTFPASDPPAWGAAARRIERRSGERRRRRDPEDARRNA